MPRFAANLSMLFTELPFEARFAAAAEAGFTGVEYLFPYAYAKADLAERLAGAGLTQVLFNLPPGNWDQGERGIACHPGRAGEFQDGVGRAVDYAKALGCRRVNCLAGIAPAGVAPEALRETLIGNLRFAARALHAAGIGLLVEPINTFDIPGFYVSRSGQGIEICDAVGSDNVHLQYDVYHMQRMEGELTATLLRLLPRIGHIQIADNPGRHEPGTGEINYDHLFGVLDRTGYAGWVGAEYRPRAGTVAGLAWLAPWRAGFDPSAPQ